MKHKHMPDSSPVSASANAAWFVMQRNRQRRRRNSSNSGGGATVPIPEDYVMRLKADSLGLSIGDPISNWPDASGNGNDATQDTVSMQPTMDLANWGGKTFPVVRFDTVDDGMETPLVLETTNPFSIFALWRPSVLGDFSTALVSSASLDWSMGTDSGSMLCYFTYWTAGASANTDDFFLFEVRIAPGEQPTSIYLNGIQAVLISGGGSSGPDLVTLGASGVNAYPAACDCAEIIFYDRFISDTQAQAIRDYFQAKYNYLNL
jgi:hypothetical protein